MLELKVSIGILNDGHSIVEGVCLVLVDFVGDGGFMRSNLKW